MANFDTSIYSQQRPFQMEDPYEGAAKMMQMRQAQRQFKLEGDVEAAGRESGGDPAKMSALLLERGHYQPAIALRTQAASLEKDRKAAQKAEVEEKLKVAEAVGSDAMTLDSLFRQSLQEAKGDRAAAIQRVMPAYQQIRANWAQMGKQLPEQFDPDANFAAIGRAKESMQYLKSLEPEFGAGVNAVNPASGRPDVYQPPKGAGQGRFLGVQPAPSPAQPTELARLQGERDALAKANPSDPRVAQYDRVLAGYKAGRGDTNVTLQQPGPMGLGKAGGNKVDEDLLGVTRGLMQLDQIQTQFKPEFQQYMDKAGFAALAVKEKAGFDLTNKQKKDLTEFASYRRNAVNSLNEYIKSITGAAMSEPEAKRILSGMPKPGDGIFDGDSPTEFKAKMDDAIQKTKMSVARLAYIKRNGLSLEDGNGNPVVALDRMPVLINERGQQIEKELKAAQPKADANALKRAVRRQLGVEFGLSSD